MATARFNVATPIENSENAPMSLKAKQPDTQRKPALGDIKNYISTPSVAEVKKTNRPEFRTPMPMRQNIQNDFDEIYSIEKPLMPAEDQSACIDILAFERFIDNLRTASLRECSSPLPQPCAAESSFDKSLDIEWPSPTLPEIGTPPLFDDDDEPVLNGGFQNGNDHGDDSEASCAPLNQSTFSFNSSFDVDAASNEFRPMFF